MKLIPDSQSKRVLLITLAGFVLVVMGAVQTAPIIAELFLAGDADDQMRLVQVRDWLAGQSWFDVRQYRVLPPEGIPMHWSRYLDAGIAAVLTGMKLVLPLQTAEYATLIIWPSLLACVMVPLLVQGNARLFGPAGSIGALAVFFMWSKLGGEFVAPRIDHHNVQILCATVLFYLSLVPGRARLLGAVGGVVTAVGLAIGLEMLPVYAIIWVVMALRHAFDEDGTGDWLIGFGVAFVIAAPLLMAGQTPMADWGAGYCDVLAVPVMALGAVGVVSTLVPVFAARVLTGPVSRIGVLTATAAIGLWLASPLLGHCLAGPYAQVSPEVRKIIETAISEALPVSSMIEMFPAILGRVLLPPTLILLLALLAVWPMRAHLGPRQRIALMQAFLIAAVGFVLALVQVRAANLMTPAIPLLGGFLVHAFGRIPRRGALRLPAAAVLCLVLPTTVEKGVTYVLEQAPGASIASGSTDQPKVRMACRNAAAMAEVASLPDALLFNPVNLGSTILVSTDKFVTSAAYHRSPDAFWNGFGAFQSEAALRAALMKTGAELVVFCVGGLEDDKEMLMRALKQTEFPVWLKPEPGERKFIAAFRVDRAAMAAAGGS